GVQPGNLARIQSAARPEYRGARLGWYRLLPLRQEGYRRAHSPALGPPERPSYVRNGAFDHHRRGPYRCGLVRHPASATAVAHFGAGGLPGGDLAVPPTWLRLGQ